MKYGMVTQIRVNPQDCQSILDLMGLLGIDPYDGRSFAQCVSLALSSALGAYRQAGTLPEPDPFQYLNRLGPFLGGKNDKKKKASADLLYRLGGQAPPAPSLQHASREVPTPAQYVPPSVQGWTSAGPSSTAAVPLLQDSGDREILETRFLDLNERLNRKEQLSQEEREEYDHLNRLFFS